MAKITLHPVGSDGKVDEEKSLFPKTVLSQIADDKEGKEGNILVRGTGTDVSWYDLKTVNGNKLYGNGNITIKGDKGDKGDTGEKGDKGDSGNSFTVSGSTDLTENLPSAALTEIGTAYFVGTTTPRTVYVCVADSSGNHYWSNEGQLEGPSGASVPWITLHSGASESYFALNDEKKVTTQNVSGYTVVIYDPKTQTVYDTGKYDTYDDPTALDDVLPGIESGKIVALFACGGCALTQTARNALIAMGSKDESIWDPKIRYHAFIGMHGLQKGCAYEASGDSELDVSAYYTTTGIIENGAQGSQGIQGPQGEKGEEGPTGPSGAKVYFHVKYSNVANPTTKEQMTETGGRYMGTYSDYTETDSEDPKKYTWFEVHGDQGIPGENGEDGVTYYLHIKYSDLADPKLPGDMSEVASYYIGTCVDENEEDPTDPTVYKWKRLKGDTGEQGPIGPAGSPIYFHVKYSDVANPTTKEQMSEDAGKYMGTYSDYTELDSDDPSKYTWREVKGEQGIAGKNGEDGKTYYLHIKYSDKANPTETADMTETASDYIGTCVDENEEDPEDPKKYKWKRLKGEKGDPGEQGLPGSDASVNWDNICAAVGKDGSNRGIYQSDDGTKLLINATAGKLANWVITDAAIAYGKLGEANSMFLSPTGQSGTMFDRYKTTWTMTSGTTFAVSAAGELFSGDGYIGGWKIGSGSLGYGTIGQSGSAFLSSGKSSSVSICGRSGTDWVITAGSTFGVTSGGAMYATGGKIAGFDIASDHISNGTKGADGTIYIGTDGIQAGKNFSVDKTGKVIASDLTLTGYATSSELSAVSTTASNAATAASNAQKAANSASTDAGNAADAADKAQATADGKNTVTYSSSNPGSSDSGKAGDIWYNSDGTMWQCTSDGANWQSIGGTLISKNIKAEYVDALKVTAYKINVPNKFNADRDASSVSIGGFTVSSSALYNGTSSLSSDTDGIYVGTDGIRIKGGTYTTSMYNGIGIETGRISATNGIFNGLWTYGTSKAGTTGRVLRDADDGGTINLMYFGYTNSDSITLSASSMNMDQIFGVVTCIACEVTNNSSNIVIKRKTSNTVWYMVYGR